MPIDEPYQPKHRGKVDLLEFTYSPYGFDYQPRHARRLVPAGEVSRTW